MDITDYIINNQLKISVKTRSAKNEITGYDKIRKAVKISINALPEGNKANFEIIKFLKKQLKREVKIKSGFKSKEKIILIH